MCFFLNVLVSRTIFEKYISMFVYIAQEQIHIYLCVFVLVD